MIGDWLPEGWEARRGAAVVMHEPLRYRRAWSLYNPDDRRLSDQSFENRLALVLEIITPSVTPDQHPSVAPLGRSATERVGPVLARDERAFAVPRLQGLEIEVQLAHAVRARPPWVRAHRRAQPMDGEHRRSTGTFAGPG